MFSECSDRVPHNNLAAFGRKGFDLHHDVCGMRVRGNPDIFCPVRLPIRVNDCPNGFLTGFALSKDRITGEFYFFRKDRLGIPTLHPIPLALRTEKRKGNIGSARQLEAPGTVDLLWSFPCEGGVCESENPTRKIYLESNHRIFLRKWSVRRRTTAG